MSRLEKNRAVSRWYDVELSDIDIIFMVVYGVGSGLGYWFGSGDVIDSVIVGGISYFGYGLGAFLVNVFFRVPD